MTDLELTKICAAAMSYTSETYVDGLDLMFLDGTQYEPMYNSWQAFDLVIRFGLTVGRMDDKKTWFASFDAHNRTYADTASRAICECVAKMQQEKK